MEAPATPHRRSNRVVARLPPSPRFTAYNDMHPFTRRSPSSSPQQPKQPQLRNGDDDNSGAPSSAMLPTPSETSSLTPAHKRQRGASKQDSARILRFGDSSLDIGRSKKEVPIYVDPSARVPERDTSTDNMFFEPTPPRVSRGRPPVAYSQEERLAQWNESPSPPRRHKTRDQILEDERLQAAVDRGDGIFYVFRGKKVYRKFKDEDFTADPGASSRSQRQLRRAAGPTAARPVTRSEIQPRRLWAPQASAHPQASQTSLSDEEAETDVEMTDEHDDVTNPQQHDSGVSFNVHAVHATPVKKAKSSLKPMLSPPTTSRTTRQTHYDNVPSFEDTLEADDEAAVGSVLPTPQRSSRKKKVSIDDIPIYEDDAPESLDHLTPARRRSKRGPLQLTPIVEDSDAPNSADPPSPAQLAKEKKRNNRSPFDHWPRTKAGAKQAGSKHTGTKRDSDTANASPNGAPAKRSRSVSRSNAGQA